MWATTKHMIICLCNTASNSVGSFLHYKVFCCMLNTLLFLMVALHNSNAQTFYFLLHIIHLWLRGMICLWDVPCNGTIFVLVMVKDIGMVQELLWSKHYELNKFGQIQCGENPLRCTTHDKKGLVLTIVLFYPIFWSP